MTIGRKARRSERTDRVSEIFGRYETDPVLDILELVELAWHDCYGEVTPPDDVVNDILLVSRGRLADLARAARLAVEDWRDLRMAANAIRQETGGSLG